VSASDFENSEHVLVLGAGNFGTCLAQQLADNGHLVNIWSIDQEIVDSINKTHRNPKYLSSASLSERVKATNKITKDIVDSAVAVVLAIPTQVLREVLGLLKPYAEPDLLIICAAKGIEVDSLELPGGIIRASLGDEIGNRACVLSGPSFAIEVMENQPTAVSMASKDLQACLHAQRLFHNERFRVYSSDDPVGLEIAGAIKNVIAIASGAVAGLGFQNNSRAAIVTRGLSEITRIGVALGAKPLTFTGLGGVGDLFLTCTSEKSRNFTVGFRLGKGETLEHIMRTMDSTAEGVFTAKAVFALTEKLGVSAPICDQVYEVLYRGRPIGEAVQALVTRAMKAEL
jgi:glycerol-3-phosphate dehydrogenase